ncbi:hypothetical protein GCM10017788_19330 [Amycolatopsis acidiphila]|nr:hypothetical protein GCM10017788_19330 [Amycolatopsis acidiphila]
MEPGTAKKYRSYLDKHVLPEWRAWPLIGIFNSYVEIEKWVSELHEDYADSTVASIFATFSTVLNAAVRAHMIPANPCGGVRVTSGAYNVERLVAATPAQGLPAAMRLYAGHGRQCGRSPRDEEHRGTSACEERTDEDAGRHAVGSVASKYRGAV